MPDQYTRTRAQLGTPALDALRKAHVAVFGIGGVGGQAVEVLDEGGLARPGAADDAQVLAGVNVQVDPVQRPLLKGGVGAVDMGQLF